jgi:hypothetical protein
LNSAAEFAGGNQALSSLYQIGTMTSFGSLAAWGLVNMCNSKLRPLNEIEKQISGRTHFTVARITYNFALLIIGVGSQIPTAYAGYYYGGRVIFWPILLLCSDSGLPMYSVHRSIQEARLNNSKLCCGCLKAAQQERFINTFKMEFQRCIELSIQQILATSPAEVRSKLSLYFNNGDVLEDFDPGSRVLSQIFSLAQARRTQMQSFSRPLYCRVLEVCVGGIARLLPFPFYIFQGVLAYHSAQLVSSNPFWAAFVISLSVLPTSYVNYFLTCKGITNAFSKAAGLFVGSTRPTLSSAFYPKTTRSLQLLALILSGFGTTSFAQIIDDNFDQSKAYGKAMMFTVVPCMFVLLSTAMVDVIDWAGSFCIQKAGSKDAAEMAGLIERLKRLYVMIEDIDNQQILALAESMQGLLPASFPLVPCRPSDEEEIVPSLKE